MSNVLGLFGTRRSQSPSVGAVRKARPTVETLGQRLLPAVLAPVAISDGAFSETVDLSVVWNSVKNLPGGNQLAAGGERGLDAAQGNAPYEIGWAKTGPLPAGFVARPGTQVSRYAVVAGELLFYEDPAGRLYMDVRNNARTRSTAPAHSLSDQVFAQGFGVNVLPRDRALNAIKIVADDALWILGSQQSADPSASSQPRFEMLLPAQPLGCQAIGREEVKLLDGYHAGSRQLELLRRNRAVRIQNHTWTPAAQVNFTKQWNLVLARRNAALAGYQALAAQVTLEDPDCQSRIQPAIALTQKMAANRLARIPVALNPVVPNRAARLAQLDAAYATFARQREAVLSGLPS